MKKAFGTPTLLLHGRDEGISDPRTWEVSDNSLHNARSTGDSGR